MGQLLLFPHTLCVHNNGKKRPSIFRSWIRWVKFFRDESVPAEHPCDQKMERPCNYWSRILGNDTDNAVAVMRIMKVAFHLGKWNTTRVDTEHFPTEEEEDFGNLGSTYSLHSIIPYSSFMATSDMDFYKKKVFQPVYTDQGICLAANSRQMSRLFIPGLDQSTTFDRAFAEDIIPGSEVKLSFKSGESSGLSFYLNNNGIQQGTRNSGLYFNLALNSHLDLFNTRYFLSLHPHQIRPHKQPFFTFADRRRFSSGQDTRQG